MNDETQIVELLNKNKFIEHLIEDDNITRQEVASKIINWLHKRNGIEKFEIIDLIEKRILIKFHIKTIRDDDRPEMWIYDKGIYIPNGVTFIKEYTKFLMGEFYTSQFFNEIKERVIISTYIDINSFFNTNPLDWIPLENGLFNINTETLEDFTPKLIFFNKLPITYNPQAKCEKIKSFIKDITRFEEDFNLIQEIFGFILYRDYFLEKAFMFNGKGRNGKGKLISLMEKLIGEDNKTNLSLQNLSDRFLTENLRNKYANLGGDINNTTINETGLFKSLTGRDYVTADRKFKTPVNFVNYAKMVFSANEIPKTTDSTEGFFQRWIILDFPFQFLPQDDIDKLSTKQKEIVKLQNPNIIDEISTEEEINGLFNWALIGLKRIRKTNTFSKAKSNQDTEEKWVRRSDSCKAFIMDHVSEDYEDYVTKQEFSLFYSKYCKKYKLKTLDNRWIKECLATEIGIGDARINTGSEREHVWKGINLKGKFKLDPNLVEQHKEGDIISSEEKIN